MPFKSARQRRFVMAKLKTYTVYNSHTAETREVKARNEKEAIRKGKKFLVVKRLPKVQIIRAFRVIK